MYEGQKSAGLGAATQAIRKTTELEATISSMENTALEILPNAAARIRNIAIRLRGNTEVESIDSKRVGNAPTPPNDNIYSRVCAIDRKQKDSLEEIYGLLNDIENYI